jgi:hypothetical protein
VRIRRLAHRTGAGVNRLAADVARIERRSRILLSTFGSAMRTRAPAKMAIGAMWASKLTMKSWVLNDMMEIDGLVASDDRLFT